MIPKCSLCGCHLYAFAVGDMQVSVCRLCDGDLVDRLTTALDASQIRPDREKP